MSDQLKALLVHAPKTNEYYPLLGRHSFINYIPMGLFSIAGRARQKGHQVKIVHLGVMIEADPGFSLARLVADSGVDTVGFSLHWHQQSWDVLHQIGLLKSRCPNVRIILGGFTASYFAGELIRNKDVDGVCVGEGERTFSEILDRAPGEDLHDIPNLVWKQGDEIISNAEIHTPSNEELDGYDFFSGEGIFKGRDYINWCTNPWFSLRGVKRSLQSRFMIQDRALFPLMTLRGCLQNCSFCGGARSSYEILCNRKTMAVRSGTTAGETAQVACDYGFRSVFFEYIGPGYAHREACALAEYLASIKNLEGVVVECRTCPDEEFLDALSESVKRGKKVRVHLSPDRADQGMRKKHKNMAMDNDTLFLALEKCGLRKIDSEIFFISGMADQTESESAELEKITEDILKMPSVNAVRVHSVTLEPASPLFENPESFGLRRTINELEDYIRLHKSPRFPPVLGYGPLSRNDDSYDSKVQNHLCEKYCRMGNKLESHKGAARAFLSACSSGACRLFAAKRVGR